jgi:capsular polysaccharide biosynthesis protein
MHSNTRNSLRDTSRTALFTSRSEMYTVAMQIESGPGTRISEGYSQGEIVLPVAHLFQVVRRRYWVILLAIMVCVGGAVGYSLQQTPLYQASIKVMIGQDQGIVKDPFQVPNLQDLTVTMGEAVATRPVVEPVVQDLELPQSPESVIAATSVETIPETQFIVVSYTDTDPRRAQRVVNAIGEAFSKRVSAVSSNVSAISAIVWEPADVPESPVSPNPLRNGLIAFVLGGMLGLGLAFLLEYLDDSWQSAEEVEQVSGVPTLAVIPEFKVRGGTSSRSKQRVSS